VKQLEGEFDGLTNSGKAANKTLRRNLQKVIDDPKADLGKVEDAARAYEKLMRPMQAEACEAQPAGGGAGGQGEADPVRGAEDGRHAPAGALD
jgi:hypothetical protein